MIDASDVARTFLSFGSMTHKKLQKLCYYAQAWHLALNDTPLIKGEFFEAWVHGPVSPRLYQEFKSYGSDFIGIANSGVPDKIQEDGYTYAFIKSIYDAYGHLTGSQLEALTHTEDPWINARNRAGVYYWQPSNEIISEEDMKFYYRKRVKS